MSKTLKKGTIIKDIKGTKIEIKVLGSKGKDGKHDVLVSKPGFPKLKSRMPSYNKLEKEGDNIISEFEKTFKEMKPLNSKINKGVVMAYKQPGKHLFKIYSSSKSKKSKKGGMKKRKRKTRRKRRIRRKRRTGRKRKKHRKKRTRSKKGGETDEEEKARKNIEKLKRLGLYEDRIKILRELHDKGQLSSESEQELKEYDEQKYILKFLGWR